LNAPYRSDLAYIHDTGFGGFARNAAPGLLAALQQRNSKTGLVVDLGCGSGILARALTDAGYQVLGVDISPAMIERARKQAPEAAFRVGSLLKVELPPCIAVTAIGECLNYLFDPDTNRETLVELFERIFHALHPGGFFACDIAEPGFARATGPPKRHFQGEDWAVLVEVIEDDRARTLTRSITTFRKIGDAYSRDEETHHLRLLRGVELAQDLRAIGFKTRIGRSYGDFQLSPANRVLFAGKPR
jgi:SAM-dependent methyltransferase